jgi:para-nitrobenzyl esterase
MLAIPFVATPAYGNPVLPEIPDQVLSSGRFHRVPVLEGITRDEGTFFAALLTDGPIPDDGYRPILETTFGSSAAAVEDRYPLSAYRSARLALAAIVSDREWAWTAEESDDLFARHIPTYSYEFTDGGPPRCSPTRTTSRPAPPTAPNSATCSTALAGPTTSTRPSAPWPTG